MKKLTIEIGIPDSDEGKLMTLIKTIGYRDNSIADQLELLGMIENTKTIIQERINVLKNETKIS